MALCVPKVMILGHSFVRRLSGDLENHFDDRAKINHFSVRVVGVCLVIKRAQPMFNKKVEVLNRYLSVVLDRPRVFVWRHNDSPSDDFLLEDGVHLSPCGQYLLYRSYRCNFKGCEHFE